MKRMVIVGAAVAALVYLNAQIDARKTCLCRPDCWCKKTGLRHLRWYVPFGHRL